MEWKRIVFLDWTRFRIIKNYEILYTLEIMKVNKQDLKSMDVIPGNSVVLGSDRWSP